MEEYSGKTRLRLVLIEDSDTDAYLITHVAEELGYDLRIRWFTTAPDAIRQIEDAVDDHLNGILLDLNLPGGSGLEVLKFIRASQRCRRSKVIVMTSSIASKDRDAAEELGVEAYLVKPNDYDEFLASMSVVFHQLRLPLAPGASN